MEFSSNRHLTKKDMLLISIPTPCHEKWNEMSPNEQGAFCSVCSKTVVDFTSLSDQEVQNYFLNKRGQKTCGRFRNDQLADNEDSLKRLLAGAIPFWKKFLAIVLVVFGSLLTGCNNDIKGDISTLDKTSVKTVDVTLGTPLANEEPISQLMGDTSFVEMCTTTMGDVAPVSIKTNEEIMGVFEPPPIEIVGEIKMIPTLDENGNIKKEQEE